MSKDKRKSDLFSKEKEILERVKQVCSNEQISRDEILDEYKGLCYDYERLLKEIKVLTSVSDRLHVKLNAANQQLKDQSEEIKEINEELKANNQVLQDTIDQLFKARVGRKATSIVLLIAIILFIISEGLIEPIIEDFNDNFYIGLFFKGVIALSLKPIDSVVERYLMRSAIKKVR